MLADSGKYARSIQIRTQEEGGMHLGNPKRKRRESMSPLARLVRSCNRGCMNLGMDESLSSAFRIKVCTK